MFDANLQICDGSADWTYANVVTSDYGSPISTTRNDGGFAVIDLNEAPVGGLAFTLLFTEAANATDDALTVILEECDSADFTSSQPHELGKFDIAAATKGVILGSEVAAGTEVILRCAPTRRYVRIDATMNSGDDFGAVYCNIEPFSYKTL
jgi:hypothetical protein